jgi:VWFA-related protein
MRHTDVSRPAALLGALVLASIAASTSAAEGQTAVRDDEPSVIFRATTSLVQFDAVVIDDEGRPVTTLTRDDIVVRQDGAPVEVRDVTFIDRADRLGDLVRRTDGTHLAAPRTGIDVDPIVLLVDDMVMTADGFARVRAALREFVQHVPDGLEVGILRTGETGRQSTTLSADRRALLQRIDAMRYLARSALGGLEASGAMSPGHQDIDRTFIDGTLGSLTSLLVNLRALPGRKTIVLLSEGIALRLGTGLMGAASVGSTVLGTDDRHWLTQPIEGRLNRLAQLAADAGVVVHTVDVSGVPSDTAGDLARRMDLRDGMTTIAERTGGLYFGLDNDLSNPLARIASLERGYYLLSYVPPDGTFVDHEPAPFRTLSVTLRDNRHRVLTRPGFFGRD